MAVAVVVIIVVVIAVVPVTVVLVALALFLFGLVRGLAGGVALVHLLGAALPRRYVDYRGWGPDDDDGRRGRPVPPRLRGQHTTCHPQAQRRGGEQYTAFHG